VYFYEGDSFIIVASVSVVGIALILGKFSRNDF